MLVADGAFDVPHRTRRPDLIWDAHPIRITRVKGKDSHSPIARLAQSAERKALNLVVVGSSPTVGAFCPGVKEARGVPFRSQSSNAAIRKIAGRSVFWKAHRRWKACADSCSLQSFEKQVQKLYSLPERPILQRFALL